MSTTFRIVLCVVVVIFCWLILKLISTKKLSLKYSLLWLASCIILAVLVIFPKLLSVFSSIIGVQTPIYALFTAAIFLILLVLLSVTVIISKQTNRVRQLAQMNALLEMRVRELEEIQK